MYKEPVIYKNLLSHQEFKKLKDHFKSYDFNLINFDGECGRKLIHSNSDLLLKEYGVKLQDVARRVFDSDSLK